ncbi:MAG: hypothetical protein ABI288_02900 [Ginsengibacter sp.]
MIKSEKEIKPKVSPLVESLTVVVPDENKDYYKAGYRDHLSEKYS